MTTHQVSLADFGITPEPLTSAQRAMRNEVALKDLSTSLGGWTTLPGWGHGIISYYDEADIKAKKRNKTKWYKMVPAGQQYFVHGNSFSDLGDQKGYALEVVYPDDPKKNKYVHTGPLHVFNKTEQIADLIYGGPIPAGWEVFHEGTKIKNPGLEVKRDRKKYLTELGPEKTFLPRLFFLTSALNDRWVLVAGRSAFPMNTKDRMKYNSPWNDYGMPHNRWAIVSRDSLRIHLKADLWGINTSAAEKAWWVNQHHAVTYPMFHIAPDDSYAWYPTESDCWFRARDVEQKFRQRPVAPGLYPDVTSLYLHEKRVALRILVNERMRYVQPHNPCEYPYPWPSDLYRSEAGPGAEQVPEIDIREVDHGDEGYLGELMGDTQIQPGLLAPPPYSEYPVEVNPVEPGSYIMVRGSSAGSNYAMGGFIYDSGERAMGGFVEEVSEQPEYGQASWEHQQQHEQQHQGQYSHGDTQLTADEQQRVWREQWDQQQQQQRLQQQEEQRQQLQATWGAAYVQQRPPPAYTSHSSVYPNATYRVADAFAHAGPSSLGAVHEGVAYEGAYPTYEEAAYPAYQETYPREVAAGRTSGGGGPPKRERQQSQQSHTSSSSGGKSKPPKKQQKK